MPTTLADIARELGVSKMTVSRAINNHPEISHQTRARILEAAQRMNYRPNQLARALTTNRSYLLRVVVPDLMHRQLEGLKCPTVTTDDVKVGLLATEHLIGLGHGRVGHLKGTVASTAQL